MLAALLLLAFLFVVFSQNRIDSLEREGAAQSELLYFPSLRFTKTATFGFTNLAADWIWLEVIQYYGRHSLSDREYKYLGHMFDLLTYLAPQFKTAYNFGALLLVTDAGDEPGAMRLLDKGIYNNPDDWSIPFTKGFINYVLIGNYREAGRWFTISSHLPNAPEMAGRFAAVSWKKGGDINTSRELWIEIYNKSRNQTEKEIAKKYIEEIDQQVIIGQLNEIVGTFRKEKGDRPVVLKDLLTSGYLKYIPPDPLGGRFILGKNKDKVVAIGGRNKKLVE
jgi:hypothetical protein